MQSSTVWFLTVAKSLYTLLRYILNWGNKYIFKKNSHFGPQVYLMWYIVITLVGPSALYLSIHPSLNIIKTAYYFLTLCVTYWFYKGVAEKFCLQEEGGDIPVCGDSFLSFSWDTLIKWFNFHSVFPPPPFQKEGGTQILKISKRGEPEKKFWDEGNQKGGKDFQK